MTVDVRQEEAIFHAARAIDPPAQRQAYLQEACGDDLALRDHVEALLKAFEQGEHLVTALPEGAIRVDASSLLGERPGSVIDRYKLLEQIGEGGFGVVFMAEQTHPVKRKVALKVLKPGMDSRQVIARFEAERQALALMDHPNIARVIDAGATEFGRPYFVMELVHGVPITTYCDANKLTPRDRMKLFVTVCQAVQHAHQKGIIHRDLKPTNVLVTLHDGQPVPKVIDFGIAKALGHELTDKTLFTHFAQMVGTPLYMSPEQAQMSGLDVDTRSDIYSLGVLLYELLTGTTPFDRERLAKAAGDEIRRIIREEEPPKPSTRLSTLGELLTVVSTHRGIEAKKLGQLVQGELDWIVMKAMEKDRARRYETASAMGLDVGRYLFDQPVEACPPSRLYRLRKTISRNKAAVLTTALIAVVLIVATAVSGWEAFRAKRAAFTAARAERDLVAQRDQAMAQERRANEQTAVATVINNFFEHDIMQGADANEYPNPASNLTIREALDRAAARIDQTLKDQPMAEAGLRVTIGKAYGTLGDHLAAEKNLRAGLRLMIQTRGEKHLDTLATMQSLATLLIDTEQYTEAEQLLLATIDRLPQTLEPDDMFLLLTKKSLALDYFYTAQFDKAEAIDIEILDAARRTRGDLFANDFVRNELACVYEERQDYPRAVENCLKALDAKRKLHGDHTFKELIILGNLGRLYMKTHQYREAEQPLREDLEGFRNTVGDGHWLTLRAMCELAALYERQRRESDAEPLLREAAQRYLAQALPMPAYIAKEEPEVVTCRLIACYRALHQPQKAAEWELRLRPLVVAKLDLPTTLPAEPRQAASMLLRRGQAYLRLAQWSDAIADLSQNLKLHPTGQSRFLLASTQLYVGDEQGYAQLRARMLVLPRDWKSLSTDTYLNSAETLLLASSTPEVMRVAGLLIDRRRIAATSPATAPAIDPTIDFQFQLVEGMLEYRRGNFEAAEKLFTECREGIDSKHPTRYERRGINAALWQTTAQFYLAMSQQQLTLTQDARQTLSGAQEQLETDVPSESSADPMVGTVAWLTVHIAAREAALLIDGKPHESHPVGAHQRQ